MLPDELRRDLDEIKERPDNWDGAGSSAASAGTVQKAERFLEEVYTILETLPVPFVGIGYDGRVVMEWLVEPSEHELLIDIHEDRATRFLLVEMSAEGKEIEIEEELADPWTVEELISRLMRE